MDPSSFFQGVKRYFLLGIMIVLLAGGSLYYLWIHRMPFTQNAFVTANIRMVTPLVPGYVESIRVRNNQFVRKGEVLLTIYQEPYRLQAEQLRHQIRAAEAGILSLKAQQKGAEAQKAENLRQLENARYLSDQAVQLYRGSAISQRSAEERVRAWQIARSALERAGFLAESLTHQIAQAESQKQALLKQLAAAEIQLEQTVLRARADGFVTNLYLSPGTYASAGTGLFAFVDSGVWFVQANLEETDLSGIREGLPARIWLWQYPGVEFKGVVESVGWGVERRETSSLNAMPQVQKENDWFLLPQRYPVQIRLVDPPEELMLHPGGSAFVQIPVPARPFRQFFWRLFQL